MADAAVYICGQIRPGRIRRRNMLAARRQERPPGAGDQSVHGWRSEEFVGVDLERVERARRGLQCPHHQSDPHRGDHVLPRFVGCLVPSRWMKKIFVDWPWPCFIGEAS
jgi:hypothetical protein